MDQTSREVIRNARRAAEDAKKVVMLTPGQLEGLLDLISDLVKETKMLKTNVENLLDRVNELEEQNKRNQAAVNVTSYATSDQEKKFVTADRPKKFTSYI